MKILSIDPGTFESAYCIFNGNNVLEFGKVKNEDLITLLTENSLDYDKVSIEMIKSYGTLIGDSVLETCVFIGRLYQVIYSENIKPILIHRKAVVTHLCGTPKAKDSNVIQALIDKFDPYTSNKGKGTKKEPGFFYGFYADIWQAFALCVYTYEKT